MVISALVSMSLGVEESGTIELVLAEVLNNVVEHAFPEGSEPGQIDIFGRAEPDGLHFCIEDEGRPMPDGKAPIGNPVDVDVDLEDLPEGGFGWFLIRDLAKDVAYERKDGKNVLNMRIAITQTAA